MHVRHVHAGPFEGLTKAELPGQLCAFAREVLRTEARHEPGLLRRRSTRTTGSPARSAPWPRDRWGVPLVHSMHTMAKVKNESLAAGRLARAAGAGDRRGAGRRGRRPADRQHRRSRPSSSSSCTTPTRRACEVVHPGVDLGVFRPGRPGGARAGSGCPRTRIVLMFVGRIQPLKAPDVAAARRALDCSSADPALRPAWSCRRRRTVRHRPGAPRVARRSSPRASASPTSCASSRRWRSTRSPTGTPRRRWCASRRTTSRSGWSPSRRRPCGTPVVAAAVGGLAHGRSRRGLRAARRGPRPRGLRASAWSASCWRPELRDRLARAVRSPGRRASAGSVRPTARSTVYARRPLARCATT